MRENVGQTQVERAIDDNPHGAFGIVLTDVGDGMEKIGVRQIRHGDQEMVAEVLCVGHVHSIR